MRTKLRQALVRALQKEDGTTTDRVMRQQFWVPDDVVSAARITPLKLR
ncbi:MAG: hypothetical protein ABIP39_02405 [Polyangiaceae bacterium]